MKVSQVNAFLRRHAAPALKASDYRRNGRKFMLDGPHGRVAIVELSVEVDSTKAAFQVHFGVITSAHRDFRSDHGFPPRPWPPYTVALLHSALESPDFARRGEVGFRPPEEWVLGDEEHNARVAGALTASLEEVVVPLLATLFDPESLARALEEGRPGTRPGLVPRSRAVAMALLEVSGAEGRLATVLESLPPDDMVRTWIERRLA